MQNVFCYLQGRIEQLQDYHNHKEIMSNAGFIVQLTLFSSIIVETVWPPSWISSITKYEDLSVWIVYSFFWFITHIYVSWQLQNKIVASLYINGYVEALKQLTFHPNTINESQYTPYNIKEESSKIQQIWGLFIPCKKVSIKFDINTLEYPNFIAYHIQQSFLKGTSAQLHERLLLYGSIIMWILASIRILL